MNISNYLQIINQRYQSRQATEHSYRGDLQKLLESLVPEDIRITNEPKRIACGAPDYILQKKDIPVGYIEAKDVVEDIVHKKYQEQFERYRAALDNLIITNYLTFEFYRRGELTQTHVLAEIRDGKICALPDNFRSFESAIKDFVAVISQSIKSPTQLAKMMAVKARLMANVILQVLEDDESQAETSELESQLEAFKNVLIHNIENEQFADMYAQTLAYGLFIARYHDPTLEDFSREEAARLIPQSNPFLQRLFQTIATYRLEEGTGQKLLWVVEELVQVFLASDVAQIMQRFIGRDKNQDPVIHFYETFLAEYDPRLRKARGVWYTPEPVVDFMVRAVNAILKDKFNLADGLADSSQIEREVITQDSKGRANTIKRRFHRVQILDPAVGTGTFLSAVFKYIYQQFGPHNQGMLADYIKRDLIPRLNGFEVLMTSYAVAHLKLDMLLTEMKITLGHNERLHIYLSNSLEEYHPDTGTLFASWLSHEANQANYIKRDTPVMVVIGNPPYSGHSANKGAWIEQLLETYKKEPSGGKLKEKNPKWLNDDYVKFIRMGQYYIDKTGEGILAFITNHSYLDNPTFRGMRWSLMQSFDEIYILDLHGNAKKKETAPDGGQDENVFDIQQGVAIAFFIKTGNKPKNSPAKIIHHELFGTRETKYQVLNQMSFSDIKTTLNPSAPHYAWVNRNETGSSTYNLGFSLQELFPVNSVGIVTARDDLVIDSDKDSLIKRMQKFFSLTPSEAKQQLAIKENQSWTIANAQQKTIFNSDVIKPIAYRPFDGRWVYFDPVLIERSRYEVMRQMRQENFGIVATRQVKTGDSWTHCFISQGIFESCLISNRTSEIGYGFPLYLYHEAQNALSTSIRTPNLNLSIIQEIATRLSLRFVPEKTNQDNTFAPIDLLDYIYAVLHCPTYQETYKEFLKIDFPRVPYPDTADKFFAYSKLGGELRQVHLLEKPLPINYAHYPVAGDNIVDKVQFDGDKIYINQMQSFDHVPSIAWMFYIGGYQPAQKWLKARKNRTLTWQDIQHYQKIICAVIETDRLMIETDRLMKELDKVGSVQSKS